MRTYTEEDEKRFNEVLREIQRSVPAEWRKTVVTERKLTPAVEFVFQKALEDDSISPEKKAQIKNILDSGMVSTSAPQEDPKFSKQIDEYVTREINKAVKAGRLPPKSHIKYLPSMLKIQNEKN